MSRVGSFRTSCCTTQIDLSIHHPGSASSNGNKTTTYHQRPQRLQDIEVLSPTDIHVYTWIVSLNILRIGWHAHDNELETLARDIPKKLETGSAVPLFSLLSVCGTIRKDSGYSTRRHVRDLGSGNTSARDYSSRGFVSARVVGHNSDTMNSPLLDVRSRDTRAGSTINDCLSALINQVTSCGYCPSVLSRPNLGHNQIRESSQAWNSISSA